MCGKPVKPIEIIVAHFGGQTNLARALGTSQGTVWRWCQTGRVPYDQIPKVIEAAAGLTPVLELRPDHFFGTEPVPQYQSAA